MTGNTIYVYRGQAFANKRSLHAIGHVKASEARKVSFLGLPPSILYRVRWGGKKPRLLVDPVDVRNLTQHHPKAKVKVLPIS